MRRLRHDGSISKVLDDEKSALTEVLKRERRKRLVTASFISSENGRALAKMADQRICATHFMVLPLRRTSTATFDIGIGIQPCSSKEPADV